MGLWAVAGSMVDIGEFVPESPSDVVQIQGLIPPAILGNIAAESTSAWTTTRGPRLLRSIAPSNGTIAEFLVWCQSASGNARAAIYDTGDTVTGTRTLLWQGADVALAGPQWVSMGAPNVDVYAGQHIDLWLNVDNTVATFARKILAAGSFPLLPGQLGQAPGGVANYYNAIMTASADLSAPATVSDADLTVNGNMFFFAARMA